jgi:tetratricopeptide (TPR) repeat protein
VGGRFEIHDLLRRYAAHHLSADAAAATRRRHLNYYLDLLARLQPWPQDTGENAVLERLEAELGNIRAALAWSLQNPAHAAQGLRLARDLDFFWGLRHVDEGCHWLARLLAVPAESVDPHLRASALTVAGNLERNRAAKPEKVRALLMESVAIQEALGDEEGRARTLCTLGLVELGYARNNVDEAAVYFREALSLAEVLGNKWAICCALSGLGQVALKRGEMERACAFWEQGLPVAKEIGDRYWVATLLMELGEAALAQAAWNKARAYLQEAMAVHGKIRNEAGMADTRHFLGELARAEGQYEAAAHYYEKNVAVHRKLGASVVRVGFELCNLGQAYVMLGWIDRAATCLHEVLQLADGRHGLALRRAVLDTVANLASHQQDGACAARLWGAAEALSTGAPNGGSIADRRAHDHFTALARKQVGESVFDAAWRKGREMEPDHALEMALAFVTVLFGQ